MRIFLTGFMGAGKSTVGRLLAARLGAIFVDLDDEIERVTGKSIRQLFAEGGEAHFRRVESDVLGALVRALPEQGVVATGGGTAAQPANLRFLKTHGLVVWLHPSFATLAARIGESGKADRPLFETESQALELYRSRLPAYRQADLEVKVANDEAPEEVAARISFLLQRRRA